MLEPDTGKLYLILPAIMPSDDENIEWLIDAGFDSFRIPASLDEDGRPQSQRVSIVQPTARITVTNSATGEKLRLPVIDSSFPAVVFNPDLQRARIKPHHHLHGTDFVRQSRVPLPADVVEPAETTGPAESAESAEPVEAAELDSEEVSETLVASDAPEETFPTRTAVPTDELKFSSWPEWSLFEFRELDITNVLLMSYGAANSTSKAHTVKQVHIGNLYAPRWFDAAGRISVPGVDGKPLYTTSPKLALPKHDGAEWTVELYYTDTTAEAYAYEELPERELVEEKIELDQHEGKPFPLFDDVFEDAWIGHYDIDVLRNGELVERRTYNMAEGFNLRVLYRRLGANFRHPDQTGDANAYTKHISPDYF